MSPAGANLLTCQVLHWAVQVFVPCCSQSQTRIHGKRQQAYNYIVSNDRPQGVQGVTMQNPTQPTSIQACL